ncbi:uncharacterized protein M421DRAFT_104670 [Didymella exigua CBS 183.55]|uniref:Monopolin complex subunit Csm1/Pcs1 C-terminal domain-containing protein n=1 Tax=Didymella exigua CBS 183.55 TaxID=1150837 RepID=A0A6A5R5T8_9PLEO|nr:uncharacterized protein M421DRAFT_104670 [Didymella exigua CBS 183.55]KAF1923082.1 hypothetical protein M421DRAFT_104670 [Didymella exigua CBS 183.55]
MSSSNYNFKLALVTGGGGGIGKALSQQLIKDGKKVIIAGRTESKLKESAREIGATAYYVLDTGHVSSIPDFVEKITKEYPDLDCLVNNAGVQRPLDLNKMDATEFLQKADQEVDINIRGPMHLALTLLPHLKSKPNALIVNISSVLGFVPFSIINPVYNGTKAWMHFWSMALRKQLKNSGVRVVEIAPPTVATDLHREREDPDDNKKENNKAALSVEEFIEETVGKWKSGEEMIAAGMANGIVNSWEESATPQTTVTMAPRNALANISFTVDSASEDDMTHDELNAMPTPDSNTENKAPARKARGKAAQSTKAVSAIKATAKGRPATRVTESKKNTAAAKKAPAKADRKALAERRNGKDSDAEEDDELDAEEATGVTEPVKPTKRGQPAKAKKAQEEEEEPAEERTAPAKRGRKAAAKEPVVKNETKVKTAAKSRSTKRGAESEVEPETFTIPETQAEPEEDAMDIEDSLDVDEIPESMPPPPRPSARPSARRTATCRTRQPSVTGRRAGSVSDTEHDPTMRRKVGDLAKKLEAMTAKYETLKDVASSGKESSFEQLKKKTDQVAKDQDAVIKALKQQVAALQSRTSELTSLHKSTAALTKINTTLTAENKKLADCLNIAQKENTTLNTKLAAARSSGQPEARVPGSAVKSRTTGVVLPGSAEAAKDAMLQKQKVEMYCDLTNLVIVGVKKNEDDEDVYDCLQTGRNGTLHFHLTISEGGESYADTEFIYQPLLDEQRDKDLLDLLPDYLTEEISFPRAHAAKFFSKVVDSMSKRIILEDEE